MATMKHVGLNVAADPLMTLSYMGTGGGLVVVVADDPGMYSSQNEQDSRNYARFAKIPMFEPSDSQEAKDFIIAAFKFSFNLTLQFLQILEGALEEPFLNFHSHPHLIQTPFSFQDNLIVSPHLGQTHKNSFHF